MLTAIRIICINNVSFTFSNDKSFLFIGQSQRFSHSIWRNISTSKGRKPRGTIIRIKLYSNAIDIASFDCPWITVNKIRSFRFIDNKSIVVRFKVFFKLNHFIHLV